MRFYLQINAYKVPTTSEKILLQKSSLGSRIQFLETDTEHDVRSKLMSVEGFPLLSMTGGFELLNCLSNSKRVQIRGVACLKIESRQNARSGGIVRRARPENFEIL